MGSAVTETGSSPDCTAGSQLVESSGRVEPPVKRCLEVLADGCQNGTYGVGIDSNFTDRSLIFADFVNPKNRAGLSHKIF